MALKYYIDEVNVTYDVNRNIRTLSFTIRDQGEKDRSGYCPTWMEVELTCRHKALFDDLHSIYDLVQHELNHGFKGRYGQIANTQPTDLDITTLDVPGWIEALVKDALADIRASFMTGADIDQIDFMVNTSKNLVISLSSTKDNVKFYKLVNNGSISTLIDRNSDLSIDAVLGKVQEQLNKNVNEPRLSAKMESEIESILTIYKQVLE